DLGHDQLDDLPRLQDRVRGLDDVGEDGQALGGLLELLGHARPPARLHAPRGLQVRQHLLGGRVAAAERAEVEVEAELGRSPQRGRVALEREAAHRLAVEGLAQRGDESPALAELDEGAREALEVLPRRGPRRRGEELVAQTGRLGAQIAPQDRTAEDRHPRHRRSQKVTTMGLFCSLTPPLIPVERMTTIWRPPLSSWMNSLKVPSP